MWRTNRNIKMAALANSIVKTKNVEQLNDMFMVSGHSFQPNDADFGVIERAMPRFNSVYVPNDWMTVGKEAKKKNPFKVVHMDIKKFVCLDLVKRRVNRKKAMDG